MSDSEREALLDADWMPAHEAHSLVSQRNGAADAATSIAKRAYAGKLRTSAELFIKEQKPFRGNSKPVPLENVLLPKEFWWARGEGGLDQDWDAGDFGTWIDQKYEWQAFGVKFERVGIAAMLAPITAEAPKPTIDGAMLAERDPESEKARPRGKGRPLTHDHPYAAAMAALELRDLPESERDRLTGPSVGNTMQDHYKKRAGGMPHPDNLDDLGASVLRALREFWQEK